MKNFLINISLAKKLSFLTLVLCFGGSLSILTQVYHSSIELNEIIIKNEMVVQQSLISSMYEEPLWNFSEARVAEVSKSFLENNKGFLPIVAIKVVDYKNQTIFRKNNYENHAESFENLAKLSFTKVNIIEIKKENQLLGKVYTASSYEAVVKRLQNKLLYIFFFAMLTSIFVSFCIYVFLNNLLIKPIDSLLNHISLIENEHYDSIKLKANSFELLLISNSLNKMSKLIKKRNDDLKNHTENLEQMVNERTSELESMTIKTINGSRLAAVGEMASGMAHEINNPLAIISGRIFKLRTILKATNHIDDYELHLKPMDMMIERITKIIKGLKNISRDGNSDPLIEFSVKNMIDEIVFLTEMKIKFLDIKFEVSIDPDVDLAFGREVQISQVLVNLVHNAVDAIQAMEDKWVRVEVALKSDYIEFKITDSGNGIPEDIKDKIMLPFFTTKEVGVGTGLGLSISRRIIVEHGGEFTISDTCPNTQFIFTIKSVAKKAIAA